MSGEIFLGEFFFAITFFFLLPTVLDCHGIRQQCVAVCNVILEWWKVKSLVDCNQKLIIIKLLNELNIVRWKVWKIGGANSNRRAESAPPPYWNRKSVSAKYLGWKSASLHLQFRRSWNPFEYYSRLSSEICVQHHKELKEHALWAPSSIGYVKKKDRQLILANTYIIQMTLFKIKPDICHIKNCYLQIWLLMSTEILFVYSSNWTDVCNPCP